MIYYLIRHKATGEFMPQLERGRGYSHWNPARHKTEEHFGRRKLLGVPRLFATRGSAHRSIVQWNAVPNSYHGYRSGPFNVDELEIKIEDDGRSKDDLEIVEVDLKETGDAIQGAYSQV